jgi:glycosyltransferase involved in cell wall biosynthesis
MKKILFVTAFSPSKKTGGQNFTRLLLKDLSKNNRIDMVVFTNEVPFDCEIPDNNVVVKKVFHVRAVNKLLNVILCPCFFPFFTCRFNSIYLYKLWQIVRSGGYDIIYLDYSQIFIYGLFFRKHRKVLMSHDVIYQKYERKSHKNKLLLSFASFSESFILKRQKNKRIFTFSDKDSNILRNKYGIESQVTSFYIDMPLNLTIEKLYPRIVLFGSWRRPENLEGLLWFWEYVYPSIKKDLDVLVIGGGLESSVENDMKRYSNVHYLGFVEEPAKIIAESSMLIAPVFQGAGVKVKVIEALALGCHVVGTSVAFEGVSDAYSKFALLAETKEDFIHIINTHTTSVKDKTEFQRFFQSTYFNHSVAKYINS